MHAPRPKPEALHRLLELGALTRVTRRGILLHLLPSVQKRSGLLGGPAQVFKNVGTPLRQGLAQVFDREIRRVSSMLDVLRGPLHVTPLERSAFPLPTSAIRCVATPAVATLAFALAG